MCQKQVSQAGINNCIPTILWDVITYPYPRYLFLAPRPSYNGPKLHDIVNRNIITEEDYRSDFVSCVASFEGTVECRYNAVQYITILETAP